MDRSTLLKLERKTQTLLMRLFELTNGNTELMATFGEAIEEWGWTDEECDQVEDYAIGQDYITRQSMGDTKIASFSLTTNGRTLAKRLILNESGDSSVGNLAVPNDRPWVAIGNPYSGGTIVYDSVTGQSWQPPTKPLSPAAATSHTQRAQDLREHIQRHQTLLRQYEERRAVEDDPRRLLEIDRNIEREKETLSRYEAELKTISSFRE